MTAQLLLTKSSSGAYMNHQQHHLGAAALAVTAAYGYVCFSGQATNTTVHKPAKTKPQTHHAQCTCMCHAQQPLQHTASQAYLCLVSSDGKKRGGSTFQKQQRKHASRWCCVAGPERSTLFLQARPECPYIQVALRYGVPTEEHGTCSIQTTMMTHRSINRSWSNRSMNVQ